MRNPVLIVGGPVCDSFIGVRNMNLFRWVRCFESASACISPVNSAHGGAGPQVVHRSRGYMPIVKKNILFWIAAIKRTRSRSDPIHTYYYYGCDKAVWERTQAERVLLKAMVT